MSNGQHTAHRWDPARALEENDVLRQELLAYRRIHVQLAALMPVVAVALLEYLSRSGDVDPFVLLLPSIILTSSISISTYLIKSKSRLTGYLAIVVGSPWELAVCELREKERKEQRKGQWNSLVALFRHEGYVGRFQKLLCLGHLLVIGYSAVVIFDAVPLQDLSVYFWAGFTILVIALTFALCELSGMGRFVRRWDKRWEKYREEHEREDEHGEDEA